VSEVILNTDRMTLLEKKRPVTSSLHHRLRQASITEINTSHIIGVSSLDRITPRQIDPLCSSERVNREIQSLKLTQLESCARKSNSPGVFRINTSDKYPDAYLRET